MKLKYLQNNKTSVFTDDQKVAIDGILSFLKEPFKDGSFIVSLCGPGGVGKTFCVDYIIQNSVYTPSVIMCCAPTHKACRNLSNAIGGKKVITIQSLFGFRLDCNIDDFDPNKNQNQQGDGERNNFFRARGGHTYTGQFYNYGDRQRYQNQRGGGYNNMRGGDRPNFNVRGNPHFYGGGRGGYNNNYNNGPRQRYGENNNYNNYNRNNNYTDRRPRYNPNYDREPIRDNEFFENEEENEIRCIREDV